MRSKTAKLSLLAVFCCLLSLLPLSTQAAGDPQFPVQLPVRKLSAEEAASALSRFQNQHIEGDFALKITLKPLGRIPGTAYEGLFVGTWGPTGPIAQLELSPKLSPSTNTPSAPSSLPPSYRFLAEQGASAALWAKGEAINTPSHIIPTKDWLTPLLPGLPYTPFDLLMPFTHWQGTYITSERSNGRIVHRFRMMPPATLLDACPALGPIELGIDGGFFTLIRAELLDDKGNPKRTLKVGSFKKVQEQWIVKTIELVDHTTRAKAELSLRAAALGLHFPATFWLPTSLGSPVPDIPKRAFSPL